VTPDEVRYCAVCGYVLDHTFIDGVHEYLHLHFRGDDHLAVPVLREELAHINECCDICEQEPVTHEWPATDFEPYPGLGAVSVGAWALCVDCAPLAARMKMGALVTRAMRRNREHGRRDPRVAFAEAYERLAQHVTGPPRPVRGDVLPRGLNS
jgi:hypothetical protein